MVFFDKLKGDHRKISETSGRIKILAFSKTEDSEVVSFEIWGTPITEVKLSMVCSSFLYNKIM